MSFVSRKRGVRLLLAAAAASVPASVLAQAQDAPKADINVYGQQPMGDPATMAAGPDVEGFISARGADRIQVTSADGTNTIVAVAEFTKIKARSGIFGGNSKLGRDSLLNGLPVAIKTLQSGNGLVASQIKFKNTDLKTAAMIRNGTNQRFEEQAAATEALRGRMGDIDKYNIKSTTNVHFDTGKWNLTPQAKADLCTTASQADAMENALLLVVGYTDSVGSEDYNQVLSEKRAGRVINYLQQYCGWKPYRMLTPTGMAEADPLADNSTPEGKAQNRRVSVNILVSKSVDGL